MNDKIANCLVSVTVGVIAGLVVWYYFESDRTSKQIVGKYKGIVFTTQGIPRRPGQMCFEVWNYNPGSQAMRESQTCIMDGPFSMSLADPITGMTQAANMLTVTLHCESQNIIFQLSPKNYEGAMDDDANYLAEIVDDRVKIIRMQTATPTRPKTPDDTTTIVNTFGKK